MFCFKLRSENVVPLSNKNFVYYVSRHTLSKKHQLFQYSFFRKNNILSIPKRVQQVPEAATETIYICSPNRYHFFREVCLSIEQITIFLEQQFFWLPNRYLFSAVQQFFGHRSFRIFKGSNRYKLLVNYSLDGDNLFSSKVNKFVRKNTHTTYKNIIV